MLKKLKIQYINDSCVGRIIPIIALMYSVHRCCLEIRPTSCNSAMIAKWRSNHESQKDSCTNNS